MIEDFFESGLATDGTRLLDFAGNEKNRFSERAGAAVLALKTCGREVAAQARIVIDGLHEQLSGNIDEAIFAGLAMLRGGLPSDALRMARGCLADGAFKAKNALYLASLLDDLGHAVEADDLIRGMDLSDLSDAFLGKDDKARLRRIFGDIDVNEMLDARSAGSEDLIERLQDCRDSVEEEGDVTALRFIHATASRATDASDRLEGIDILEQLGYRALSRELFKSLDLDAVEPLWVAEQCSRFGWREEALRHYRAAVGKTCSDNNHLILAGFADLDAGDDIAPALALMQAGDID